MLGFGIYETSYAGRQRLKQKAPGPGVSGA